MFNSSLVEPADFLGSGIFKCLVNDQIGSGTIVCFSQAQKYALNINGKYRLSISK
jgi:hypothetical protein